MQDFFRSGCPELSSCPSLKRDGRRDRERKKGQRTEQHAS